VSRDILWPGLAAGEELEQPPVEARELGLAEQLEQLRPGVAR
jgi:hypothetical protein